MAAEQLSSAGLAVTVYDRMPSAGRKFLMAGRGGLNLTHSEDLPTFLQRYGPARDRLARAIEAFPPAALRVWSEDLGQPTFVGSSGRIFPVSIKSSPLLRAWLARLSSRGVMFRMRHSWIGWADDRSLRFRLADDTVAEASPAATILALGGASWPRLGSDGAWVRTLSGIGLPVAPFRPANSGFRVAWTAWFRDRFEGQPLKPVALSFGGRTVRGEVVVTRTGLEGGALYAISAALRDAVEREGRAVLSIDLRPDVARDRLAERLGAARRGQSRSNLLRKAGGLSPPAINLLRESAGANLPAGPEELASLIKALPLTTAGPEPIDRAISTAGGIRFDALDEHFMLTAMPGVFAAGEMLDWEAPTGGYLLQACFATGAAAAAGALRWFRESPGDDPGGAFRPERRSGSS